MFMLLSVLFINREVVIVVIVVMQESTTHALQFLRSQTRNKVIESDRRRTQRK